jgi:ABC-type antimicrobial peptide transport system permease subunit
MRVRRCECFIELGEKTVLVTTKATIVGTTGIMKCAGPDQKASIAKHLLDPVLYVDVLLSLSSN